jgi:hypothetical protein
MTRFARLEEKVSFNSFRQQHSLLPTPSFFVLKGLI